jgi:DNA-binding SARP family transcriptional activator
VLRAQLFGGLAVEIDECPLPTLPGVRPRSVLAFLLYRPGLHPRVRLAGWFWPDVLDTSARASLRSTLWSIRQAFATLGGGEYLVGDRSLVGINPELPRDVDIERFARLVAAGDVRSMEAAVDLARGPLLADLPDEWVLDAQDECREQLITLLERLADAADEAGDRRRAVKWTREALEHDRLREGTYRLLMRRLEAMGEPAQAVAAYRRCKSVLQSELGIAPSSETRRLFDELRTSGDGRPAAVAVPRRDRREDKAPAALIGRAYELSRLQAVWDAAASGHGGVVFLEGEAGIGKSRLVEGLAGVARSQEAHVLRGSPLELAGGPPFAPWSEIFRELIERVAPPATKSEWPSDLARLCPMVVSRWGFATAPGLGSPELDRARLFEAAVEAIAWAAASAPLLLVLADLHRADSATLALLAYLGRRLADMPCLLVATRRPAATSSDFDAVRDALRARGAVVAELALGPLAGSDVKRVIASVAPGLEAVRVRQVIRAADGNPLFAREGARAAAAGEDPAEGVRATIRSSLGRLPPPARLLVEVAATAARPLEMTEVADAVGVDAAQDAFIAGCDSGLLEPAEHSARFVHELVRKACYADLSEPRRRWLHGLVAGVLTRRPTPTAPAEIARHLRLSGDDAAARPYLTAAAQKAQALGALDEAADFLTEALDCGDPTPVELAELWLSLGEIESWRESRKAMDAAFSRAIALLEAEGQTVAVAAAYVARGHQLRTGLCYPRESLAAYRRALELIDSGHLDAPEVRALALAGAAWAEAMAGDAACVEGLIEQVEALPEAEGDAVLAVELDFARVAALIRSGRLDEVDAPGNRAIDTAARLRRADLLHLACANVACAASCRGDFDRVLTLAERALAGPASVPTLEGYVHAARAYALSRLGRHSEAIAAVEQEVQLFERYGQDDFASAAAFDSGSILLAAGDFAVAADRLADALAGSCRHFSVPLARLRRAEACIRMGALAEAEEELAVLPFEPVRNVDLPQTLVAHLARLQGLIAIGHGDHAVAVRRLREAEAGWRRLTRGLPAGELFTVTLTDLGRPPVAGLVEPGIELARVLVDLASALEAAGHCEEAVEATREADELTRALRQRSASREPVAVRAVDAGV